MIIICNTLIYRVVLRNHQAIYKFKLEHDHEQIMTTSLISDGSWEPPWQVTDGAKVQTEASTHSTQNPCDEFL